MVFSTICVSLCFIPFICISQINRCTVTKIRALRILARFSGCLRDEMKRWKKNYIKLLASEKRKTTKKINTENHCSTPATNAILILSSFFRWNLYLILFVLLFSRTRHRLRSKCLCWIVFFCCFFLDALHFISHRCIYLLFIPSIFFTFRLAVVCVFKFFTLSKLCFVRYCFVI